MEKKINWNLISSIGTPIASITAIYEIFQGNCQFSKSLDRSDQQIRILVQESELRNNETRPLISITGSSIYNLMDYKQFKLIFQNVGSRPAYNLVTTI